MDGYIPKSKEQVFFHSFQKDKKQTGTLENFSNDEKILQKYKQQYLEFWDYILHDVGKEISFKNIGHNHP
jgi:hypothetical protein